MKIPFIYFYRDRLKDPIFQNDELLQTWVCCNILATYNDSRLACDEVLTNGELLPKLPLPFPYKEHIKTLIKLKELEIRGNNLFVTKYKEEQRSDEGNKVKFPKSIKDNPIWCKPELFKLYFYCYLVSTYKDEFKKVQIGSSSTIKEQKTGTFISGRNSIAEKLCTPPSTIRSRLKILEKYGLIILKPVFKNFTYLSIVNYLTTVNKKIIPVTNTYSSVSKYTIDKKKRSYDQHMKPQIKGQPEDNRYNQQRTTESQPEDTINKDKEIKENQKNKENKPIEDFDFFKNLDFKTIEEITKLPRTEIENYFRKYKSLNNGCNVSGFNNYLMQEINP